jgi:hypothetical protein
MFKEKVAGISFSRKCKDIKKILCQKVIEPVFLTVKYELYFVVAVQFQNTSYFITRSRHTVLYCRWSRSNNAVHDTRITTNTIRTKKD